MSFPNFLDTKLVMIAVVALAVFFTIASPLNADIAFSQTTGSEYDMTIAVGFGNAGTAPSGSGWTVADMVCVRSDAAQQCLQNSVLWKRPSTQPKNYVINNCTNPGGYTLKSQHTINVFSSAAYPTPFCLWEGMTGTQTDLLLGHAGTSTSQAVNCRTSVNSPTVSVVRPVGYNDSFSRACVYVFGNCVSDICLFGKNISVSPPPQCTTNSQCGTDGLVGSPFCQSNTVFQNFRTFTCNNPGTPQATCNSTDTPQLQQTCSQNQTCSNGSCITNASPLVVSCAAQPNPAATNQLVTFNSAVSGGMGSYTYTWAGSCNGIFQNCSNIFSQPSTYTAFLNVTSGNQTASALCPVIVTQSCTPNASQRCVGNAVYNFDSCGNQGSLIQTCNQNQTCSNGSCMNITCSQNSQCGTDAFVGSPYCQNNSVFQDFKTFTCNNPGTTNSSCSNSTIPTLKNTCFMNQTCSGGVCITNPPALVVSCNAQPNPATTNQPVTFNSTVSGGTGSYVYSWTGSCTGSTQTCSNIFTQPNTYNASLTVTSGNQTVSATCPVVVTQVCTPNTSQKCVGNAVYNFDSCGNQGSLIQTCNQNQTCSNGSCVNNPPALVVSCNSQPNPATTNQSVTFNSAVSGGTGSYTYTWAGSCNGFSQNCSNTYSSPSTYTAFLHVVSGNQTQDTSCQVVVNQSCTPNTSQRCVGNVAYNFDSCGNQGSLIENCSTNNKVCSNGACVSVTCTNNSQCGTNGLVGSLFCQGNSVYQNFKTFTCNNPGAINSSCSDSTVPQLQSNCGTNQTCSNGTCSNTTVACTTNSQCGTDATIGSPYCQGNAIYQLFKTFTCNNPGTSTSSCSDSTSPRLQNTCVYGQTCSNGTCNTVNTCTSHSYQQCLNGSVHWFDSCGNDQGISQACTGNQVCQNSTCITQNTCSYHSYQRCQGNAVYWYDSCGSQQDLAQVCSYNQTCQGNSCIAQNTCTYHASQRCQGNAVYWYDSCGNQQDLAQTCSYNQTCSNNTCVGQSQGSIVVTKTVRNLSSGNLTFSTTANASPNDILQFNVAILAPNNQSLNNVTLKDTLPANLSYKDSLTIDGLANSATITSGLNIGSVSTGQTRIVTYQAQVAPPQNFSFGTTTLNNYVTVTADPGSGSSSASASVTVIKSGVQGASTVSTGLTNNFFADSFFLPLVIALLGVWLFRSGFFGITDWIDSKKLLHKDYIAQKRLKQKIMKVKHKDG